jgi:hypothetical protein
MTFKQQWGWDTISRIEHDQEMDHQQQMAGTPQWMKDWIEQWQSNQQDEQ